MSALRAGTSAEDRRSPFTWRVTQGAQCPAHPSRQLRITAYEMGGRHAFAGAEAGAGATPVSCQCCPLTRLPHSRSPVLSRTRGFRSFKGQSFQGQPLEYSAKFNVDA